MKGHHNLPTQGSRPRRERLWGGEGEILERVSQEDRCRWKRSTSFLSQSGQKASSMG